MGTYNHLVETYWRSWGIPSPTFLPWVRFPCLNFWLPVPTEVFLYHLINNSLGNGYFLVILKDTVFYSWAVLLFLSPIMELGAHPAPGKGILEDIWRPLETNMLESLLSPSTFNKLKQHTAVYQYSAQIILGYENINNKLTENVVLMWVFNTYIIDVPKQKSLARQCWVSPQLLLLSVTVSSSDSAGFHHSSSCCLWLWAVQ